MYTARKSILALTAATAMIAGAAVPVAAQSMRTEGPPPDDPVMEWAEMFQPPNRFVLNSREDVEIVRYKTPRDVEICIGRPDPNAVYGTKTAVPVRVSWDTEVGTIWPGNCMSFDAKSVKLRAAAPLPEDDVLTGTFRVKH